MWWSGNVVRNVNSFFLVHFVSDCDSMSKSHPKLGLYYNVNVGTFYTVIYLSAMCWIFSSRRENRLYSNENQFTVCSPSTPTTKPNDHSKNTEGFRAIMVSVDYDVDWRRYLSLSLSRTFCYLSPSISCFVHSQWISKSTWISRKYTK